MNRGGFQWIAVAVGVLGLAVLAVIFGLNLLPSRETATERGVFAGWVIAWGMIAITVASALTLAGYLVSIAGKTRRSH